MMERDWMFGIGPLDEAGARSFRDQLQGQIDDSLHVQMFDDRVWFANAWDVESVRDVIPVLEAGLSLGTFPVDIRHSAMGFLDDMRSWLDREYDPNVDAAEDP